MTLAIPLLLAAAIAQPCLPVSGDNIVAADLAKAIPEFSNAPPETAFGYAPNPGATRVLRVGDIARFARQAGVELNDEYQLCFEWELRRIPEEAFLQAMRKAWDGDEVEIRILDVSRFPAPPGELVFDPADLSAPPPGDPTAPVLWRGHVHYSPARRLAVWARVQVTASMQRVAAIEPLRAGEPIPADALRVETYRGFPSSDAISKVSDVAGRVLLRPLAAGSIVPRRLLREPIDVRQGVVVEVTVVSGPTLIRTEGVAEDSGRRGETIVVRNPKSGRTFRAVISGVGQVIVRLSGG